MTRLVPSVKVLYLRLAECSIGFLIHHS